MCDLMKHEISAERIEFRINECWIIASTVCTDWDRILQSVDMFVKLLESRVVLSAYILVWVAHVGIQPLSIAVLLQEGALVFLFYNSLRFDDSPTAECQCADGGTGLGAGRIYCHDAGDRLHGSVPSTVYSLQQYLQTRPNTTASKSWGGKNPKISRSNDIVTYLTFAKILFSLISHR